MSSQVIRDYVYGHSVEKAASRGERVMGRLFPNRGTGWPGGWTDDRLKQVYHFKNWAFVAIDAIASMVAQLVPNIAYVNHANPGRHRQKSDEAWRYRQLDFGNAPAQSSLAIPNYDRWPALTSHAQGAGPLSIPSYYSKALSPIKPHEELEPVEIDHPLRRLIENPNPINTPFELAYELEMFMSLTGVAYEWIIPNDYGVPSERWCIPSHWVWPHTGGNQYVSNLNPNADRLIQWYEVRPWGGLGSAGILRLPPDEVIVHKWPSPINFIDGYSKMTAISMWIDVEESIGKSRWSQMINQARPEFWVELGQGYEDPDDDRIARYESKFMAKYQGEYNYGKPFISPPGAKATVLSFSPNEMAYFNSEDQVRDQILAAFRVPGAAVGTVKEMTFGSILATAQQFCRGCINPRLIMMGQTLTKFLASRYSTPDRVVRIFWDDAAPPDPAQINMDLGLDISAAAVTVDEIRAIRGRPPYPNGRGANPMVQGPGGLIPMPLATGEDLTGLADLIPILSERRVTDKEGEVPQADVGAGGKVENMDADKSPTDKLPSDPNIAEPNGKPQKQLGYNGYQQKLDKPHKFSSTQFNVVDAGYARSQGSPLGKIEAMANSIDDGDLTGDGREDNFHITVKYGIHSGNADDVARIVQGFGPVTATLGKTSLFESDDADVVKIDVASDDLERLNKLIGDSLECTDTHPEYHPHLTLAYVESGAGEKYVGMDDVDGMQVNCTVLIFSDQESDKTPIVLTGKRKELPTNRVSKALISIDEIKGRSDPIRIHLPDLSQSNSSSCGAVALMAIAEYFGVGPETEQEWIDLLGTDDNGTPPQAIIRVATELGMDVHAMRLMTLNQLETEIAAGRPVMVPIQAYSEGGEVAEESGYDDGHWVAVVGMDHDKVYVEDSMLKGAQGEIPLAEFVDRWHDVSSSGEKFIRYGISFWRAERLEPVKSVKGKAKKKAAPKKVAKAAAAKPANRLKKLATAKPSTNGVHK